MSDYDRIAKAIAFIEHHVTDQPSLDEIAAHVHLSPFHFQRLFSRWAGITPKRFLQVLTLERGKTLLQDSRSLLEVSDDLGLSSSSRLHDHFVQIEAVTPGEFKSRGQGLTIHYGLHSTPFGPLFVASTERGICRATFVDDQSLAESVADLQDSWPLATLVQDDSMTHPIIDALFAVDSQLERPLSVHVTGTNFQIAVWRALLKIPAGTVSSYSAVADMIGRPRSVRAVANAIGANPIAFLIPCHRVIQQSGALGGYRWGPQRKQVMQTWERARWDNRPL
ncbi:MAG TPA: bifunctional helix-turn-helix domain-containing protein/methylated-DNA--[protein]-cysteine S-methyltransferase [Dongiaceae bacterium]|nr:bifunctional helix-turn-helix domain-containing protein/methylated-DNA--[protein]-cysteine S-methyltransferase [Dongiaceae bacterium]